MAIYFTEAANTLPKIFTDRDSLLKNYIKLYDYIIKYKVEEEQRNPQGILQTYHKYILMQAQWSGEKAKVYIKGVASCNRCSKELAPKTLEYELSHTRLPYQRCPNVSGGKIYCEATYHIEVENKTYSNTHYGRRKWREQSVKEFKKLTPEQQLSERIKWIGIILIILIVMWILLGTDGFLKWATK
jgi:hypothetical protein